jgi:hypothetical protein
MIQIPIGRLGLHQSASYTGTAGTTTNPISAGVYKIRVICTTAAYVKIDKSPTATTADVYVAANVPEYFIATPGESVSAVQVSAAGTLHVTEAAV